MKLREIYELVVMKGMEHDPREREVLLTVLENEKKAFDELKDAEKQEFDQERLVNPFADTRVLAGEPEQEVRRVLAGIDMEVGEVLLADRLGAGGAAIDLIIAHHPEGKAMAAMYQVMKVQADVLAHYGVPINVAEGILASRISEVKRGMMPLNHNRAVDAAKLLGISFMCVHTATDNLVQNFLQKLVDAEKPSTLGELLKLLKDLPEYARAITLNAGPTLVNGDKKKRAGRIMVDMTGGTSGSAKAYEKMAVAGVGTVVLMHISENHRKEAEKHHINVIVAGHIASDSLGMNLFLDDLAARGVEIVPCSGLIRIQRQVSTGTCG